MSAVKSAVRTLQVLELFAQARRPLALAEVARLLPSPKSSCLALLSTLCERGYLYRVGAQAQYYPTRRWLGHALRVAEHEPLASGIRAALERLRQASGETAIDAVLAGHQSIYLDVVESLEMVRYTAQVGDARPLHASASGRAQLSMLPPVERQALIRSLPLTRYTRHTRVSRRSLEQVVDQEQAQGWSVNLGEFRADVVSIAAGFRWHGSVHALVIAAPHERVRARVNRLGQTLHEIAASLAS